MALLRMSDLQYEVYITLHILMRRELYLDKIQIRHALVRCTLQRP